MRAAVLYGQEDLRVENVAETALGPGEVRVEIEAALTCGTDLKVYRRGYHARMIVPPAVFGHELAGTISALGAGVSGWALGDQVVAANSAPCGACFYCARAQENLCDDLLFLNGAYAESIVVPARIVEKNLLRLAPATDFASAALCEPLACVIQGVNDTRPRAGERVLILGSGPIGLMFARLCREADCTVTVAGRGARRLELARHFGVQHIVEIADREATVETIRAQTTGSFDVVFEAIGQPATWEAAVALVRKGGRVNLFGGCPAGSSVRFDCAQLHYANLTVTASFHHTPATFRQALSRIEQGIVRAAEFVDGTCALAELPQLFAAMNRGNRAVKTLVQVRE